MYDYIFMEEPESFVASRGAEAQACDCIRDRFWIPFPLEEMKYLTYSFPRFDN